MKFGGSVRILAFAMWLACYLSPAQAGTVDFVPYFEPASSWTNNVAAQNAVNGMLGPFEAILQTGGAFNAVIEVYFTDNEATAFASASSGSTHVVTYKNKQYFATNPWAQIVQNLANPNGVINPATGANADIIINWNFGLSTPEGNIGLLRHELLHPLGMTGGIPGPSLSSGLAITRPGVGTEVSGSPYTAAFVDFNGNPVLGAYGGNASAHTINDYVLDTNWDDANGSGLAFRGIADSGALMDMALFSFNPSGGNDGVVDPAHVYVVSYANKHPTWSTVVEVDRAFLRGMGYTVLWPGGGGVAKRDFNGDGRADILWQNQTDGRLLLWFMNGAALAAQSLLSIPQIADTNWQIVGAADFNGDRNSDILWQNIASGYLVLWFMDGATMISQAQLSPYPQVPDTNWRIAGTGDFNKDGKCDILWRNISNGYLVAWFMDGANLIGQAQLGPYNPIPTNWEIAAVGDFNGNGEADIVWRETSLGALVAWFMDGVNVSSQTQLSPHPAVPDLNWRISSAADLNGDGKSDLLWQHTLGYIVIWFMDGANMTSQGVPSPYNATDPAWRIRDR